MNSRTLKDFIKEVGKAFEFPDYYGENIDAFWDCIRDLSWLNADNYTLKIENSRYFLTLEDEDTQKEIYDLLEKVREDWANVPNYKGEDQYRSKADFCIQYLSGQ